jgi:hypothetical protein
LSPTLLIAALIAYILGLVAGLLIALAAPRLPSRFLKAGMALHFLLLSGFGISAVFFPKAAPALCLAACCMALVWAGAVWRVPAPFILRLYFGLYLLTLPLFLYAPSQTVRLIAYQWSESPARKFSLAGGLRLEPQEALLDRPGPVRYKIIRDYGIFYRTLERDLDFGFAPDSVQTLRFEPDSLIVLRAWAGAGRDSSVVVSDLKVDGAQRPVGRKKNGN